MRLLLDTQVCLWFLGKPTRVSRAARRALDDAEAVFVSAASVWEAAIKASMGKLDVNVAELIAQIEASGFNPLTVTFEHAARVAALPAYHRDPFDRLLIAQAVHETMRLLTTDRTLARYSELVMTVD
ncbi:MAG: type II toxin-antitoxin system VapC family toxin [Casimicrobiaceae bacterium]